MTAMKSVRPDMAPVMSRDSLAARVGWVLEVHSWVAAARALAGATSGSRPTAAATAAPRAASLLGPPWQTVGPSWTSRTGGAGEWFLPLNSSGSKGEPWGKLGRDPFPAFFPTNNSYMAAPI